MNGKTCVIMGLVCLAVTRGFLSDPTAQAEDVMTMLKKTMEVPLAAPPAVPGKRDYGPEQVTGKPDTHQDRDVPTAWVAAFENTGPEWLKVTFNKAVKVAEVHVYESHKPGAVVKITTFDDKKKEVVLWQGEDPLIKAPDVLVVEAKKEVISKTVKIYLDTTLVNGWNEIDAVRLVGKDGSRQWASSATASSTYADRPRQVAAVQARLPVDPFLKMIGRTVSITIEGEIVTEGKLVETTVNFLTIKNPRDGKLYIVNKRKIILCRVEE